MASDTPIIPSAMRSRIGSRLCLAVSRMNQTILVGVPSLARPQVSASRGASGAMMLMARSPSMARIRRLDRQTARTVRGLIWCSGM